MLAIMKAYILKKLPSRAFTKLEKPQSMQRQRTKEVSQQAAKLIGHLKEETKIKIPIVGRSD